MVYLIVAMTLSVFNIRKAKREDGTEIEPEVKWGTGTVRYVWFTEIAVMFHSLCF
jgi:hypothetical protein